MDAMQASPLDGRFARGAAALAVLLLICAGAPAASLPATRPAEKIAAKPGTQVSFPVDPAAPGAGPRRYAMQRVVRSGREMTAPPNMRLDANTGTFSWTPRVSQAGPYELTFLVYERSSPQGRPVVRRIVVEPGPVTTDRGEAGKLLHQWFAEGTAAGNVGDFYDNRDRGHSRLNLARFPQLDQVEYPQPLQQRRLDWGLQLHFLFKHVTFGNSSTSSGPTTGGCNSRRAVLSQRAVDALYRQYRNGHLYIYPEHRDHDPGHNGRGGYGDLFPANVPYLITSQGSSGSDRPFMEAVASTLAAFRPDVKQRLIETGLLMPTLQMILRACGRNAAYPKEYLTGKAHPTVFEGANIDVPAMVRMAHEIRADSLPPMVQLAVVEEDEAVQGRDYFDPRGEKLLDSPAAIARIARSSRYLRRMVVSAKASYDANARPLSYHWAVLRGDAQRIEIKPRDEGRCEVELLVPCHERRPIRPGAEMGSTRVDIGCFVHNGRYYSAPGFVCFYWLDDEARTYGPDGRVLEVAYGWGDSTIGYPGGSIRDGGYDVADWEGFLDLIAGDADGLGAELLRRRLSKQALAVFQAAAKELTAAAAKEAGPKKACDDAEAARKKARDAEAAAKKKLDAAGKARDAKPTDEAQAAVAALEEALKKAEEARKAADKQVNDARRKLTDAQGAANAALTRKQPRLAGAASIQQRMEKELNDIKNDPSFYVENAPAIRALYEASKDAARKKAFDAARDELVKEGILACDSHGEYRLSPILDGPQPAAQRLTKYERSRIEWFHVAVLQGLVYPGMLNRSFRRNFVSPMVATPANWRDVYHYDAQGRLIGWTRCAKGRKEKFTADGALVEKQDKLGRALEARAVQYIVDRDSRGMPRELKYTALPKVLRYEYESDADRVGRAAQSQ